MIERGTGRARLRAPAAGGQSSAVKPSLCLSIVLVVASAACADADPERGDARVVPADWRHTPDFLAAYKPLQEGEHKVTDPVSGLALRPNDEWSLAWKEHPDARIARRTNNRGFSEDAPTPVDFDGERVLVLGDSHTEGVVRNDESFANVLERLLAQEPGAPAVDVLNAGVGYTGPRLYLGMLRKHLDLEPDLVVATLFTGNDFWNDLWASYLSRSESAPAPGAEYFERLTAAQELWSAACWQGVNQIVRFRRFPEEREASLRAVVASFEAMQALCDERGARFLAVVLPTKFDTDSDLNPPRVSRLMRTLELEPEDLAANARLGDDFVRAMAASGIDCLDTTPVLRADEQPCYWRRDHHLNVHGHARVAEAIASHLRDAR